MSRAVGVGGTAAGASAESPGRRCRDAPCGPGASCCGAPRRGCSPPIRSLGVGPDNFRLLYGAYAGLPGADARTHSNNMYLEMLAGGGLRGGAAFGWLSGARPQACAAAARARPRRRTRRRLGIAAAVARHRAARPRSIRF